MNVAVPVTVESLLGSIVAFAKLQGLVSGAPLIFNNQHKLNALIGIVICLLVFFVAVIL